MRQELIPSVTLELYDAVRKQVSLHPELIMRAVKIEIKFILEYCYKNSYAIGWRWKVFTGHAMARQT